MRLYLDACCLNRLTDDQSQDRVRTEAEAVERILGVIREGRATWVSSAVLEVEISRNPDTDRHHDVAVLLRVDVFLKTDDGLLRRARRHARELRVRVENPVSWYKEVLP
ncbi:MAG: hypothetical protein AAB225_09340 [Acidobacteriota bacterium]